MKKFNVGDRIVKPSDTGGSIKPGQVVTVIPHPRGEPILTLDISDHDDLLIQFTDGWCTAFAKSFVLEEVYNSPLYKALYEE